MTAAVWHTTKQRDYLVVIPEVGRMRQRTAARLLVSDEDVARRALEDEEVALRIALMNHLVATAQQAAREAVRPTVVDDTAWAQQADREMRLVESEQVKEACREYTPYGTQWMPHDTLRQLYAEWRAYYERWKRPHVSASSLLSSMFCSVLVDATQPEAHQIHLSREILHACLEVTNDCEIDATDALSYNGFTLLVKNLGTLLFAPKHPYVATHLIAVVLHDRIHRAHES